MYTNTCINTHIYDTQEYIPTYKHKYTYIHIHKHTHTYTHKYEVSSYIHT